MRQRCRDPNIEEYPIYGGRRIRVCSEWDDYKAFRSWAMVNGYSDNLTIDRIDSNGNYEPSNCRWATYVEQNNNLRSNKLISFRGKTKTAKEWSREFGIKYGTFQSRLRYGWSMKKIAETPIQRHCVSRE